MLTKGDQLGTRFKYSHNENYEGEYSYVFRF